MYSNNALAFYFFIPEGMESHTTIYTHTYGEGEGVCVFSSWLSLVGIN